ncbi:MAG: hypothetical protein D6705_15350 [Deltaproteobacteria bacterium]|nr:MAG: hypothetical protein D6705_15350 [Deltaproteobacteria bacterium]
MTVAIVGAGRPLLAELGPGGSGAFDLVVHLLGPEDRPPHGLAGLVDFVSGGAITDVLRDRRLFAGRDGEAVMLVRRGPGLGAATLLAGLGDGAWDDGAETKLRLDRWVERIAALGRTRVIVGVPAGPHRAGVRLAIASALARAVSEHAAEGGSGVAWTLAVEADDVARLRHELDGPLRAASPDDVPTS